METARQESAAALANQATLLYDVVADPQQLAPLADAEVEGRLIRLLVAAMAANDATQEQFERLGLPRPEELGNDDEASVMAAACVTTTARGARFREHNGGGTPMGQFAEAAADLPRSIIGHLRPGVQFGAKAAAAKL
jgi:hypothetical protein